MRIIRKPKSGDRQRGLSYGKNINWAPGQICLIVVHGIGERGNETTELHKPDTWGGADGGWHILQRLGDQYGFNLIYTQSSADNTIDEITYAIEQAVEDPDMQAHPDLVACVGLSWGGRRLKIFASKGFPGKYKPFAITRLAAGGIDVDDWTPTIAHNIPTLLIHGEADPVVQEKYTAVSFIEGRKKDLNAPIYYVELRDDPRYKDEHNITRVLSDKVIDPALCDTEYLVPKMSWLQWLLMNSWSERPVSITETYHEKPEPVPAPPIIPAPGAEVKPIPDVVLEPTPVIEPLPVIEPEPSPEPEPVPEPVITGFSVSPPPHGFFYVEVIKSDGTKEKFEVDVNLWMPVRENIWKKADLVFRNKSKNIIFRP